MFFIFLLSQEMNIWRKTTPRYKAIAFTPVLLKFNESDARCVSHTLISTCHSKWTHCSCYATLQFIIIAVNMILTCGLTLNKVQFTKD